MLELGPIEQTLAKQAIRMGQPIPDKIANAPELILGLQLYLQAFFDLDSERSHALAISVIPWSSIKNYADSFDFSDEQTEDLFYLIKKMDIAHTNKLREKQKANANKPQKTGR